MSIPVFPDFRFKAVYVAITKTDRKMKKKIVAVRLKLIGEL